MGFFKKIFKGIKKVFKKIGRGIKKGFQKFGKFMNKIGIVGQIAMMFILPMVGNALVAGMSSMLGLQGVTGLSTLAGSAATAATATTAATVGTGLLGSTSALLRAAGMVVKGAGAFAKIPGNIFNSVTKGITNFAKWGLNKVGINVAGAPTTLFGKEGVFGKFGQDISNAFDPLKALRGKPIMGEGRTLSEISQTSGISVEDLANKNYDIKAQLGDDTSKWGDFVVGKDTEVWTTAKPIPTGAAPTTTISDVIQPQVEGTSYEAYKAQFEGDIPDTTVTVPSAETPSLLTQEQSAYDKMVADATEKGLIDKKPDVTIPDLTEGLKEEKSRIERGWEATKKQYFPDPITGIKTGMKAKDWYSARQQEDPIARYGGGVLPGLGYYGLEDFQAYGTTVVSPGDQLLELQKQGMWGLTANLDEQLNYRQQLNKNLSLGLGGGT